MARTIHLYPDPEGGWLVKKAGENKDLGHYRNRDTAERVAWRTCQEEGSKLVIHDLDGSVEERLP